MMGKLVFLSENSASSEAHGEFQFIAHAWLILKEWQMLVKKTIPETKMSRVDQTQSRKDLK